MLNCPQRKKVLVENGRKISHQLRAFYSLPTIEQSINKVMPEDNKAAEETPQPQADFLRQPHLPPCLIFPPKYSDSISIKRIFLLCCTSAPPAQSISAWRAQDDTPSATSRPKSEPCFLSTYAQGRNAGSTRVKRSRALPAPARSQCSSRFRRRSGTRSSSD